jgi:hypothetical protein
VAGKVTLGSRGIAPDQGLDAKISLPEDRVAVQLRVQKVVGTADDGQLVSMQIYRHAVNSSIPSPVRLICCSLHPGEQIPFRWENLVFSRGNLDEKRGFPECSPHP